MRGMIGLGLIGAGLALASAASASTPAAWAALEKKVAARCVAKSALRQAQLLPGKLGFSDAIGIEVRMVRGKDRRGRTQTLACAYDRRSGQAEVQEAPDWAGKR